MILTVLILLVSFLLVFTLIGLIWKNLVLIIGGAILLLLFGLFVLTQGITYYNGQITNTTSYVNASNYTITHSIEVPIEYNASNWVNQIIGLTALLAGAAELFIPLKK